MQPPPGSYKRGLLVLYRVRRPHRLEKRLMRLLPSLGIWALGFRLKGPSADRAQGLGLRAQGLGFVPAVPARMMGLGTAVRREEASVKCVSSDCWETRSA